MIIPLLTLFIGFLLNIMLMLFSNTNCINIILPITGIMIITVLYLTYSYAKFNINIINDDIVNNIYYEYNSEW